VSDAESLLKHAQRIRAIAQTGLEYSPDPYDRERFEELAEISHELLAATLQQPTQKVADIFLPERGYPTPKVDVRAGVFRDDKVLLVLESADQRWTLPGGWADEHQSPKQCVEREALEESGFEVVATRLVAVKDRHLHPYMPRRLERIYKLFFLCELIGGEARTSLETSAVEWFAVDALPELSTGRTLADDIRLLDQYRRESQRPCYFD
jgi:ADP-ribose pyrophosphatase YjhB (NUDIX family)